MWGFDFLGVDRFHNIGGAVPGAIAFLINWYRLKTAGIGVGPSNEEVGEAIITRMSPKNFETTSGLKTVGDNEGAYTGEGVLLESDATNELVVTSNNVSTWSNSGAVLTLDSDPSPNGNTESYIVELDSTFNYVQAGGSIKNSAYTGCFSVIVKDDSGICVMRSQRGDSSQTVKCRLNSFDQTLTLIYENEATLDKVIVEQYTAGYHRYTMCVSLDAPTSGAQIGMMLVNEAAQDTGVTVWQCDIVNGTHPSSIIYTSGSPVTRNADTATVPTSDAFVDAECFLADWNLSGFTGGISNAQVSFFAPMGSTLGKYNNKVNASWAGAILTAATGEQIEITSTQDTNTMNYSILRGSLSEVKTAFAYPATFTIDFSHSAYDLAGAKSLADSINRVPEVSIGVNAEFSSIDVGATVNGKTVDVNATYGVTTPIVEAALTGSNDIKSGDVIYYKVNATITSGTLNLLGTTLVNGENIITVAASDVTLPTTVPILTGEGTCDAQVIINEASVRRWSDCPTDNFRLSFDVKNIGYDEDSNNIAFASAIDTLDDYVWIGVRSNGLPYSQIRMGGVNSDFYPLSPVVPQGGDFSVVLTKVGSDLTLSINGESFTSTQPNWIWQSIIQLARRSVGTLLDLNGIYSNLRIEELR